MKKKSFLVLLVIMAMFVFTGCQKENTDVNLTISEKFANVFKEEMQKDKDMLEVAKTLSKNENIKITVDTVELTKDDYIMGFDTDITGFNKAVSVVPMIGTIPFVMYIFEVTEAQDFAKYLEEHANKRWNICTEADELKIEVVDNYVFLVMTPSSFE